MKWLLTFLIGALVGAISLYVYSGLGSAQPVVIVADRATVMAPALPCVPVAAATEPAPSAMAMPASEPIAEPPLVAAASAPELAVPVENQLLIPVAGIKASALQNTFDEARSGERRHEAIDILAPKGTQVFAVADGKIAKLFNSKPGGLTLYQFDTSAQLAYYYAHLDRYADGVQEGMALKRGDLVGYVGTSGNADPNTPHLHFAVFVLGPEKQWWKGSPINPYPLLGGVVRP
ncbi:M23 family metallopeptidase [Rhodoferax sp.]|uniref:M23 family metallopeptidase n=1 Tax=Rhodoferax sp. TaxID=50421 RepID=UPI002731EEB3|nr:peptidoglycan DD-metalloendopeptidase family protein [Rhodoferax sp.]MDP1527895.1 peptidoglycan DD-metalloendopeptidase family protein [Rhodoferax sp.]MDP1944492.1 peptidoglycan DD-metalloendopeptidase family protein [Rhodoferax sp.]MDP2440140.1 peptidoglycan DD-metalloendopeptidase family protein [Rhodoferax sp.]MDZ4208850.1 peptidoglycan DD-metalloendopeptidase family protein [Rhodoferax sp.]